MLGAEIVSKSLPLVENVDAEFFAPLTKQETHILISLFQKLIKKKVN